MYSNLDSQPENAETLKFLFEDRFLDKDVKKGGAQKDPLQKMIDVENLQEQLKTPEDVDKYLVVMDGLGAFKNN